MQQLHESAHAAPLPSAELSQKSICALRCALQAQLRKETPGGDLLRVIAVICGEAHRRHMRAEELVVLLKSTWATLPEIQRLPRASQPDALLSQAISACIERFYALRMAAD